MNVCLILLGKYPTDKAYGITTHEVATVLTQNEIPTTIYALKSNITSSEINDYTVRYFEEPLLTKILKKFSFSGTSRFHQLTWKIFWKILILINKQLISSTEAEIYWVRDLAALDLVPLKCKVVIELHSKPDLAKFREKLKSRDSSTVLVAPISSIILRSISELESEFDIVLAPMGIRIEQIADTKNITHLVDKLHFYCGLPTPDINVGYVGKFSPNGYSKGVEDLLDLAVINSKSKHKYRISISGGSYRELIQINESLKNRHLTLDDVSISGHVPHHEALARMSKLDFIVLTRPASLNYFGFPLKTLEAIASGRVVIAADCEVYRNIFNGTYQPYWYIPGDPYTLLEAIKLSSQDPKLSENILSGLEFAAQFTWENRVKNILSRINPTK